MVCWESVLKYLSQFLEAARSGDGDSCPENNHFCHWPNIHSMYYCETLWGLVMRMGISLFSKGAIDLKTTPNKDTPARGQKDAWLG